MERASRALCAACVWAGCLLPNASALAADSPPTSAIAAGAASTTATPTDAATRASSGTRASSEQSAAAAYRRALSAYAQGDVEAALRSMREAYQLSNRPELLYNLARLEQELENCRAAQADYARYLELVPDGQYRAAATEASEQVTRTCAEAEVTPRSAAATAAPVVASAPTVSSAPGSVEQKPAVHTRTSLSGAAPSVVASPAPYWTATRWVGWSAIAAGAIAGGGALYFHLAALGAHDDLQRSVDAGPPYETRYQARQNRDQERFGVLAVAGGALLASGTLLLILSPQRWDSGRSSAVVYAQPGLLGASIGQRF